MRIPPTSLLLTLVCAGCCVLLAQTSRSLWDGVYTVEQAQRGSGSYASNCAACHGTQLTGGESAPALTGGEFLSSWNGLTVADLFDRIRTTMPADRPGRVTREQNADILAYMLSMNQYPAGKVELEHQTEALSKIQFDAYKK